MYLASSDGVRKTEPKEQVTMIGFDDMVRLSILSYHMGWSIILKSVFWPTFVLFNEPGSAKIYKLF
ncbi:MAG: hypothetical protein Q7S34_04410 [bacterium]|nr:hypothetical protein [bacterium]